LIKRQDVFDVEWVNRIWTQHLSGCANHDKVLWSMLMFQDWYYGNVSSSN